MSFFPVTESTLAAAALADEIEKQYGLRGPVSCKLLRTGMNHLYLVTSTDSNYVFRVYTHGWRSFTEIAEELRVLTTLKANDVSVSHPVSTNAGDAILTFHAPEGTRYGVMFSFAEGKKNPRFSAATSHHIGRMMARMHNLTKNLQVGRVTYTPQVMFDEAFAHVTSFFGENNADVQWVFALQQFLKEQYRVADESKFSKGVVHLDVWFDNIHIKEESEVTFFDFDFCGNAWLIHDVAYFLMQLHATNSESDYQPKATAFLEGYTSIRALTPEEVAFIPYAGLSVFSFYLGVQCRTFDTWSNIFLNEDHLKRFTGILQRWTKFQQLQIVQ